MTVRERWELLEGQILQPGAALAQNTKGRERPEEECSLRTCYQRDRDRILHCKAFRRLKYKTQVFLSPEGDHYRTRLTHTLEVSQIARTISRCLGLNEDLTEAIALGHDLGHTPFGHAGERALNDLYPTGFRHYEQSVRVVERLEKAGQGLNLTFEVRDGILHHTIGDQAATMEGRVVRLADRVAYINHDIDDAERAGVLSPQGLPREVERVLGNRRTARIDTLIRSIVENSSQKEICMAPDIAKAFETLHSFMFATVYRNPVAKGEETKVPGVVERLYRHYCGHVELLPKELQQIAKQEGVQRAVCDYIAGMSDRFAIQVFEALAVPKAWSRL